MFDQIYTEVASVEKKSKPGWVGEVREVSGFGEDTWSAERPAILRIGVDCSEPELLERLMGRKGDLNSSLEVQFTAKFQRRTATNWWQEWNTENTWECPAAVFRLSSLVTDLSAVALKRLPPPSTSMRLALRLVR